MLLENNRWRVVLVGALFFLYEFFQINMFNVLEHSLMRDFQATAQDLGWLSSMYFYGTIVLLFPAGLILDRVSTRKLMLFAMSVTILGTLFFAASPSLWVAGLGRLAIGLCAGPFALIAVIKLATRWFTPAALSFATGMVISIGMFGGVFAQVPFHMLVDAYGWRTALCVDAGVGAFFWLCMYRFVWDGPLGAAALPSPMPLKQQIKTVMACGFNWRVGLYACFTNLPIFLLGSLFSTLYLTQVHRLTPMQAASVASMIFIGMLCGSPFFGWLSGRLQRRRAPMLIGAGVAFVTMLLIILLPLDFFALFSLFFVLGVAVSAHTLVYPCVAESNAENVVGSAEGLSGMLIMAGGAIFQPLFGKLLDWQWEGTLQNGVPVYAPENFLWAMSLMPICLLLGILILWGCKDTYGKNTH